MARKKSTVRAKTGLTANAKKASGSEQPRSIDLGEFQERFSTCNALVAVAQHALVASGDREQDAALASYAETVLHETRQQMEAMNGWLDYLQMHYERAAGGAK